jgi:hypothetical protein
LLSNNLTRSFTICTHPKPSFISGTPETAQNQHLQNLYSYISIISEKEVRSMRCNVLPRPPAHHSLRIIRINAYSVPDEFRPINALPFAGLYRLSIVLLRLSV